MVYNVTTLYDGGVIGFFNSINTNSNFILLDVLIIVVFIVMYGILSGRTGSSKNTLLLSSFIVFIVTAAMTFAVSSTGQYTTEIPLYVTRVIVTFSITVASLIYHVYSEL